jgi:dipeptidase E
VAIGGGENGRPSPGGVRYPYELAEQDKEIIRLTGKEHPNFLLIAHSQPIERQEGYFQVMVDIYGKIYGCPCKDLKSDALSDAEYVKEIIEWADIIFEGGGNTLDMIKLWKDTGFDDILRQAWESGKVMCGVSAGANCWFKECSSDSLKIKYGDDQPLIGMECLGLVDGLFVPHCDEPGRLESAKELLRTSQQIGLLMSNCTALEIVDDQYRLITSDASYHGIQAYGLKAYWDRGEYVQEKIDPSSELKPLKDLLSKQR